MVYRWKSIESRLTLIIFIYWMINVHQKCGWVAKVVCTCTEGSTALQSRQCTLEIHRSTQLTTPQLVTQFWAISASSCLVINLPFIPDQRPSLLPFRYIASTISYDNILFKYQIKKNIYIYFCLIFNYYFDINNKSLFGFFMFLSVYIQFQSIIKRY